MSQRDVDVFVRQPKVHVRILADDGDLAVELPVWVVSDPRSCSSFSFKPELYSFSNRSRIDGLVIDEMRKNCLNISFYIQELPIFLLALMTAASYKVRPIFFAYREAMSIQDLDLSLFLFSRAIYGLFFLIFVNIF